MRVFKIAILGFLMVLSQLVLAQAQQQNEAKTNELPTVIVTEKRGANELPAAIKESPISLLRYHPQVDLQTRGIAETQADISIWGGLFENTGVKIGAINLFDLQTGHYGSSLVDASYYALNFAKQRLSNSVTWDIQDSLILKLDVEARIQEENPLRNESDDAFEASFGLVWLPEFSQNLRLDLIVDNLTNSNFQEFPGTHSTRRSVGLRAKYSW